MSENDSRDRCRTRGLITTLRSGAQAQLSGVAAVSCHAGDDLVRTIGSYDAAQLCEVVLGTGDGTVIDDGKLSLNAADANDPIRSWTMRRWAYDAMPWRKQLRWLRSTMCSRSPRLARACEVNSGDRVPHTLRHQRLLITINKAISRGQRKHHRRTTSSVTFWPCPTR